MGSRSRMLLHSLETQGPHGCHGLVPWWFTLAATHRSDTPLFSDVAPSFPRREAEFRLVRGMFMGALNRGIAIGGGAMGNRTLVYLDHAATSWPKPAAVGEQLSRALTELTANAGRSGHSPSVESARLVFQTRECLGERLGVARSEDLAFTRGCTEGLNLVIKGMLAPGARVAVSPMEHNSVMRPLVRMARQHDVHVVTLPADPCGRIDMEASRARVQNCDLVVVCHASNVNGVIQDIRQLREVFGGTPLLVDAAQTAGVLPIDVTRDGVDFLACSAHKGLLGPTGVGACYLSPRHDLPPLLEGGTGSSSESLEHPTFRPDRYEAGTLNLHGLAGTLAALKAREGAELLGKQKQHLTSMLLEGLRKVPGVHIQSPTDGTAICVSFTIEGLAPNEIAERMETQYGVIGRPGLQCAPAAHQHLRTFPHGTMRLSPGHENSPDDIEIAIHAVSDIARCA
ncbi:MAG: aminotransferase class V-fold PLP-dependent enzyme [Pirellulaceae bacterium]